MTKEKLAEILEKHKLWLDGKEYGAKANLRGANLREANLREANLSGADLRGADGLLSAVNFMEAHFTDGKIRCEKVELLEVVK